ncbi:hypothetical protein ACVILK_003036 [Bradyrhizobium embrapense]
MIQSTSRDVTLSAYHRAPCPAGPGAVTRRARHRQIQPERGRSMAAAGRAITLPKTRNSLRPVPPAHSVGIQARFMSETRPRLSSKATLRKNARERPFYSAGLNPAPALCARKFDDGNKMGVAFGPRSVNRHGVCRTRGRLSAPRWENARRSCSPRPRTASVMRPDNCFQKRAGVSSLARGTPSVAGDVGGVRRQTTLSV